MIAIIQRVKSANVKIDNKIYSSIRCGYLIFLGIFQQDTEKDIPKLTDKILHLRIMADEKGKMNKSILETKGEILVVSQFTLCANLKGGRRPDFFPALEPKKAKILYNTYINSLQKSGLTVKSGQFGAYMNIELINDGPVTFIIDSQEL